MIIKKQKLINFAIFFLMAMLVFFSIKYYKIKDELLKYKEISKLEVKVLESQLGEILYKYDSLSEQSDQNAELFAMTVDSLTINTFSENKNNLSTSLIKDSIVFYTNKAKELNAQITTKEQVVSKDVKLPPNAVENSLYRLSASNINAKGVKIYSDLYKSSNALIQQLRVCYTLQRNDVVKSGSRKIYIQVVNPKNQIISKDNLFVENNLGSKLQFSAISNVNYNKKDTDVCVYVDLEKNKTIKGNYIVNIYSDFVKIGSTIYEYK